MQQQSGLEARSEASPTLQSKKELAKKVLSEMGIAKRYDLYLGNSIDMSLPSSNSKFRAWLQSVLASEAGWKKIEDKYIARLATKFSESELKELLKLSQQPLVQKLFQEELQGYVDVSEERRKLMFKVWDDYNSGKLNPPSGTL